MPADPRIFISYSTKDGSEAAAALRCELEEHGFSIWQDIVALRGSADWWSQIEHALRSKGLQHFVLVITPGALASRYVRDEIRLARQEGKTVSPVRGPGIDDMADLPRWLGNLYDLAIPERKTVFLNALEQPSTAARVPMTAPEPPEDFVARPNEFDELKRQLLDRKGDAVAIAAALRGAGGYGKTTLAKALAHDPDIRDAYFDGVLWAELGEQGASRAPEQLADLIALMTGEPAQVHTLHLLGAALGEALGNRRILLVVDDVWQRHHLEPFLQGGPYATRLVTTRFDTVLPEAARGHMVPVDAMQGSEAAALLAKGLTADEAAGVAGALGRLAERLGEWAQLLKLANGFLLKRTHSGMPLDRAVADLERRFDARGVVALDPTKPAVSYEERHRSVARVIGTSLDLLAPEQSDRFGELGVFPEDVDIPVGIAARLWAETGGLDEFESEDLLVELSGLSLLQSLDLGRRTLRLHDTTRHYLRHCAGEDGLAVQNRALVRALADLGRTESEAPAAEREYYYRNLPQHLADAGDRAALDALLLDPAWLKAKLAATHSPQSLVADYEQHGRGRLQDLIGRTLRLAGGICARDERQLLSQLIGRLMAVDAPEIPPFLAVLRQTPIRRPAFLPLRPGLTPPGAETARLEGHAGEVGALAVLPDGRLAAGSHDRTVRLWDLASGAETARLKGHAGGVTALAVLPDGRLASGSGDETVRLWDLASGAETARLAGHAGGERALAVLPDGRLASGSGDGTVRLWDLATGAELARLELDGAVFCLAVLPAADGRGWRLIAGDRLGRLHWLELLD